MRAKPPVPSKKINPLQGLQQSKIDFFKLGDVVREKVKEGILPNAITDYINDNYFTDIDQKISDKSVRRWIKKNIDNCDNEYDVNVYNKTKESIECIDDKLDMIDIYTKELRRQIKEVKDIGNKSKDLKDYLFIAEKFLGRKQSCLNDLFKMQEKVREWCIYIDMLNAIFVYIKQHDSELSQGCIELIKANPVWLEALKKIQPSS